MIPKENSPNGAGDYSIPELQLDLKNDTVPDELQYLYELTTVDDSLDYIGHPDSVFLKNGDILTVYPSGHGKGAVRSRISHDAGKSYTDGIENQPSSWQNSRETPTVYRLEFSDGTPDKLLLVSGNPDWNDGFGSVGGFNYSLSDDEGKSWSEFELCFGKKDGFDILPIVALASLTRLKENGKFVDKWMGFFHNPDFVNYKTVLSFQDGKAVWSVPVPYFSQYREIEKASNMCEVEVIRSDGGMGDELCLITRSNTKKCNSLISFSSDEGETWSEPVFAPSALNGERHKADYTSDGRLFITFRSIERDPVRLMKYAPERADKGWFSEGWVAWVGRYEDLHGASEGEYRIKLAHVCTEEKLMPQETAGDDTGYCGNVVLPDDTIVTSTYGAFGKRNPNGGLKTYVVSKRIRLSDTDKLLYTAK